MKPRRFPHANQVFRLDGGNEDNDLWVERTADEEGNPCLRSLWVPTDDERREIANGANLHLIVWGSGTPPLALAVTADQPGKQAVKP